MTFSRGEIYDIMTQTIGGTLIGVGFISSFAEHYRFLRGWLKC